MKTLGRFVCGPPGYSFQSNLTLAHQKSSRENSKSLWPCFSLFHQLSTSGSPPYHQFSTACHSASIYEAPPVMSRASLQLGDSMKSNLHNPCPSPACLAPMSPRMNPWEQTCSSGASCSSTRETIAEWPSLKRRTVLTLLHSTPQ